MNRTLDIIIVNWNSGRLLKDCLHSISLAIRKGFILTKVIIVDNASKDESLINIGRCSLPIELLKNEVNIGFAQACNLGASISCADYILFLNPDTLLRENSLYVPIQVLNNDKNENIGIIGIQLENESGEVVRSCGVFPTPMKFIVKTLGLNKVFPNIIHSIAMTYWEHKENNEVNHVMGSFFLLRRKLFNELGRFDCRFFVYLEDLDFCLRVKKIGKSVIYITDAKIYHEGGGLSKNAKERRIYYSLRSRILYSYKHFNWADASIVALGTIFIEPITRIVWAFIRRSKNDLIHTIKGYSLLVRALPEISRLAKNDESVIKSD